MRVKILIIRIVLGLFFAFLLARFFYPPVTVGIVVGGGALLVLFSYAFEAIHTKRKE